MHAANMERSTKYIEIRLRAKRNNDHASEVRPYN